MNSSAKHSSYWLLFSLFCGGVTYLFYGASLSLPFFFDDFVHYPFVEANNVARIWLTTDELAYYRPLNFTLWRLTYEFFQRHHPFVDHAINLLLHAANGFMVGWLASRLWTLRGDRFPVVAREDRHDDWWRIVLSAVLFLLFPFSYQAVPWVGSLSHLLVTTLILLAVLFYVQMRRTRLRIWGVASLFFAFLAPFAHENGVLVMPFVVLVDLTTPALSRRWRQAARTGFIWTVPLLVYIPVWLSLPRLEGGGLFSNSSEGIAQNAAYFIQGAAYPFSGLGGWLHYDRGLNDMTTAALLSGLGLLVAALIQLTHHAALRSWFPWLWIVLGSLPAVLFLKFEYVINGPRLLMVASVGIAWLWADVILLFSRGGRHGSTERLVRGATALGLTLLLLAQNGQFLHDRMTMHEILGDGFKQVIAATAEANAAGEEMIVINFPSWLAPKTHTYALGHEGALFWPDYVPPQLFMAVHTGELGDLSFVKVDGIRPELQEYYYGLTGPNPDWATLSAVPSQVLMTDYGVQSLALTPVGDVGNHRQESLTPLASFTTGGDESIHLFEAQVSPAAGGLKVDTLWQASGAPPQTTLYVHVVDGSGNLVAQADGDPLGGSYPLDLWTGDGRVLDTRWIPLNDTAGVSIRLGLYDRLSGDRVAAVDPDGEPYADNAVPLTPGVP